MYNQNKIDEYIKLNSSTEDPILTELNRETHLKILNSRMISGHPQGKLLELISKMTAPTNILEIGTYTGYSAICLAKGLRPEGCLYTIDINDELERIVKKYIAKSGLTDKIKVHWGDALEIIPELDVEFDLVFIDADKKQYTEYYNSVINKVKSGGILLADNVLWNKKVLENEKKRDQETNSIVNFNKMITSDPRVENCIIPLRDGISVIRKI